MWGSAFHADGCDQLFALPGRRIPRQHKLNMRVVPNRKIFRHYWLGLLCFLSRGYLFKAWWGYCLPIMSHQCQVLVSAPVPVAGYWPSLNDPDFMIRCAVDSACCSSDYSRPGCQHGGLCLEGYAGVLCGQCSTGYAQKWAFNVFPVPHKRA